MVSSLRSNNRQIYTIATLVAGPILLIDYLRLYILLDAYFFFGRLPVFRDGFERSRAVIYSWNTDELILLYGHFLHLVLIPLMFLLLYLIRDNALFRPFLLLAILMFIFEIGIRFWDSYEYIMYD